MNYFLDTCVGLGYVFCTNPWNDKSEHLFNIKATFYISYCVGKELTKTFKMNHSSNYKKNTDNFYYSKNKPLLKKPLKNKSKRSDSDS